jgi:glycine/D-amino acid oxidase-like deaminating enzyme
VARLPSLPAVLPGSYQVRDGTREQGLDENRACWVAEAPAYEARAPLDRDESADVAVIGGGLTGVSTAWHLSRAFPERRIALIEARALGNGASGRSGGQTLTGVNGVEPRDPAAMRRIYEVTRAGIDVIADWVQRYGLDAGLSRRGCIEIQTSERSAEAARARVERWNRAGVPLEWSPGSASGFAGARGAVRDPAGGRVNALALLRAMRAVLEAQGVRVFEGTSVLRVHEGHEIRLTTRGGEVRAGAVVLATNAYTPGLGYFRESVLPLHSHVVATAPLRPERWSAIGWGDHDGFSDDRDRISFGCRTAGGRLLFGGGANDAYGYSFGGDPVAGAARSARAFAALERRLATCFPAVAGLPVERRWTGALALTLDRVCSIGVRGRERNVYFALGYSGHGLALAALAGRVLRDLYAGDTERWRDLPFFQRRLPRLPPEPLRWLGYQVYTRLTGRSPRRQA